MTYTLYGLCIVLTLISFLKDKDKTKKQLLMDLNRLKK